MSLDFEVAVALLRAQGIEELSITDAAPEVFITLHARIGHSGAAVFDVRTGTMRFTDRCEYHCPSLVQLPRKIAELGIRPGGFKDG